MKGGESRLAKRLGHEDQHGDEFPVDLVSNLSLGAEEANNIESSTGTELWKTREGKKKSPLKCLVFLAKEKTLRNNYSTATCHTPLTTHACTYIYVFTLHGPAKVRKVSRLLPSQEYNNHGKLPLDWCQGRQSFSSPLSRKEAALPTALAKTI